MRILENWSVVSNDKNFFVLEPGNFIRGELEGQEVMTSAIHAVEDDYVATENGSIYKLGTKSSAYEEFMAQKEVTLNEDFNMNATMEFILEDLNDF